MELTELRKQYNKLAQCKALHKELAEKQSNHVFLQGLFASSPAVVISTLYDSSQCGLYLIVLNSQEDAAYFYHDLVQILGDTDVLYFPSAYRRAAKYGQRDDANAILRTEVLSRLSVYNENTDKLFVVTSPDALAEPVVSKTNLSENTIFLEQYATVDRDSIQDRLFELGFERVDYVYEPGQYAVRGSILDVFSFSSENPYRIDFFGDDIDSIRQFSVETQLSLESMENAVIVPGMSGKDTEKVSLLDFIPESSVIVARDMLWTADRIESIKKDIDNGVGYVSVQNGSVVGYAAILLTGEVAYKQIADNEWGTGEDYVVVHRLCVKNIAKRNGIALSLMKKAKELAMEVGYSGFRIDTHRGNIRMLRMMDKLGFKYRGIIYYESGERLAYDLKFSKSLVL